MMTTTSTETLQIKHTQTHSRHHARSPFVRHIAARRKFSHLLLPEVSIWRSKIPHRNFTSVSLCSHGCEVSAAAVTYKLWPRDSESTETIWCVQSRVTYWGRFKFTYTNPSLSLTHSQCQSRRTAVCHCSTEGRNPKHATCPSFIKGGLFNTLILWVS